LNQIFIVNLFSINNIVFEANSKSLSIIQLSATIGAIVGFWYFDFNLLSIITAIFFYFLYTGVGVSMMLHRYYTHRSFKFKWKWLEYVFGFFAVVAGRGSIIGWVHVHREHHAFSDTEKDPHYPKKYNWKIFFPYFMNYGNKINRALIRDFYTKNHLLINKYYMLIILSWVLFLAIIDPWLMYFGWFLPMAITQIMLNSFIYLGHNVGYTGHEIKDDSKNNLFFGYLLWGEGWHNNHHKNARNWKFGEKWWEIDVVSNIIKLVKV
jgi:fatty-acid desaturase